MSMKRRPYTKPESLVIRTATTSIICGVSNTVQNVGSNASLKYRGGGNGESMSRGHGGDWDDEDE